MRYNSAAYFHKEGEAEKELKCYRIDEVTLHGWSSLTVTPKTHLGVGPRKVKSQAKRDSRNLCMPEESFIRSNHDLRTVFRDNGKFYTIYSQISEADYGGFE
nr:hypothetical protein HmN_000988300 [Hymenolepis microstoma]